MSSIESPGTLIKHTLMFVRKLDVDRVLGEHWIGFLSVKRNQMDSTCVVINGREGRRAILVSDKVVVVDCAGTPECFLPLRSGFCISTSALSSCTFVSVSLLPKLYCKTRNGEGIRWGREGAGFASAAQSQLTLVMYTVYVAL